MAFAFLEVGFLQSNTFVTYHSSAVMHFFRTSDAILLNLV
jgi:hypothetical protein